MAPGEDALIFVGTAEQILMLDEAFREAYCFAYLAAKEDCVAMPDTAELLESPAP